MLLCMPMLHNVVQVEQNAQRWYLALVSQRISSIAYSNVATQHLAMVCSIKFAFCILNWNVLSLSQSVTSPIAKMILFVNISNLFERKLAIGNTLRQPLERPFTNDVFDTKYLT